MKKTSYLLIFLHTLFILGVIFHYIFNLFNLEWQKLLNNLDLLQSFAFFVLVLGLALTILLAAAARFLQHLSLSQVQKNLKAILEGRGIQETGQAELDDSFVHLKEKLDSLTENLQKSENQVLQAEEKIIEKERRRIARDLHDTVSQELFAANMILSGVAGNVERLDKDNLQQQLKGIADILETAQKDLRILLLHLRPTELENRTLVEGMNVLIKELTDKSDLTVQFKHEVIGLPKQIEEHIFRIIQEIINNTLRHAQASRLDIYLYQTPNRLKLKVSDDGIGFDPASLADMSYGLKNIEERVAGMGGQCKIISIANQGTIIEIKIPQKQEKE